MRICPICGTKYPNDAPRCCAFDRGCRAYTVEYIEPEPVEKKEVIEDEDGIIGRAGQIIDLITSQGPMTYNQIGDTLSLSYKRVVRLVSQMVRDGIDLKREGRPRKVSLG